MFDEKLNAILSRPYDKNEYEELSRIAKRRKINVSGKVDKSYLDYHPGKLLGFRFSKLLSLDGKCFSLIIVWLSIEILLGLRLKKDVLLVLLLALEHCILLGIGLLHECR
jgi:hypothetical protein